MNENITKEVMEEYELLRQMGLCNMFAFPCVKEYAKKTGLDYLAEIDKKDYLFILKNYSGLMEQFEIKRD